MSLYEDLKEEKIRERKEKLDTNTTRKYISKEKTSKNEQEIIVGKYSDAPDYLKDNELIKDGYIINCHSLKMVLRSLFVCSNETMNIWSHLIGCIISILLIIFTAMYLKTSLMKELTQAEYEDLQIKINETIIPWSSDLREHKNNELGNIDSNVCYVIDSILSNTDDLINDYGTKSTTVAIIEKFIENTKILIDKIVNFFSEESNILDDITTKWEICVNKIISYIKYDFKDDITGENIGRWPLFIMLSAAIICFGFSTSFHWFSIYSKELYSFLCRLDYAGITFLIPGSCYPPYFYFYYCEKWIGKIYLAIISTFSFIVFVCTLTPGFHGPNYRRIRGSLFLILGVSTSIPIFHLAFFGKYINGFEAKPHLIFWYIGGIVYVMGGLFFVTRIPEKYIPNKFDYCFHSHNNLHICVLIAFIFHFFGAIDSFYYRQNNKCPIFN